MKLGYTIIYVENVIETVSFYENAFGLTRRFIHESQLYAEMETGETALAFAAEQAVEINGLAITPNRNKSLAAGWEICLITDDVQTSFDKAIKAGAFPIATPANKPWGQTVSYVRDNNGCIVEISSLIVK